MERIELGTTKNKEKIKELILITGEKINDCMQCGKCSAGCPAASQMDILPHQIIRYIQLGEWKKLIESKTLWICASCFACASRCPRDLDVAKLLEGMRVMILQEKNSKKIDIEKMGRLMTDEKMPQQAIVSAFRKYSK
ncbi:MAG: 4Fe-4S dicluster domain-containing protein [Psychrilyobacter sp.]|nr:4Fe-4S dicluster domain-containing protein [Psychrilyobacter sp.]